MASEQSRDEQREQREHDTEQRDEDCHRVTTIPNARAGNVRAHTTPRASAKDQMPMRCARSSRWYVASPSRISELFARLK